MSEQLYIELEKTIPFYDVDSYQIVWHGNYPRYFEEARCALLAKIGCSYTDMEDWGFFFPIIDLSVKYVQPLTFNQRILITARLVEWRNKVIIRYTIIDATTGQSLTKASTAQVAISMPNKITQFESPIPLIEAIDKALDT